MKKVFYESRSAKHLLGCTLLKRKTACSSRVSGLITQTKQIAKGTTPSLVNRYKGSINN